MKTFRDFILECELVEGKVEWDNPDRPLQSGLTPREKNRARRIETGIENPNKSSFSNNGPSERDYERYGNLKAAHDKEKDKKIPKNKIHRFKPARLEYTKGQLRRYKLEAEISKDLENLKEPKESFDYNIDEGIQPLPIQRMLRKIKQKSKVAQDAMYFRRENQSSHTGDSLERLKAFTKRKIAKKASQIKKMKTVMRTHDPVVGQFKELENKVKGRK